FAGRGQPVPYSGIRASRDPVDRDQIAFRYQLLRHNAYVRKCPVPRFQSLLVFFQLDISMDAMIDEILCVKLFVEFEASPAEEFLECAFCECLVLLLQRGRTSDACEQE